MKNFVAFFRQVNSFCAKLNAGLMAVALVLAILVAAEATTRVPEILDTVQQAVVTTPAAEAAPATPATVSAGSQK